jgi:hypothetical protein
MVSLTSRLLCVQGYRNHFPSVRSSRTGLEITLKEKFAAAGNRIPAFQPVARRHTDGDIPKSLAFTGIEPRLFD